MLCSLDGDSVVEKKQKETSYVKLLCDRDSQTDSIECRRSFCAILCDVTPFGAGLDDVTSLHSLPQPQIQV
jgi:hypothetical protein